MSQTEIPDEPITIDSESHLEEVVDEHQGLAAANGVQGVPTMVLYADGKQAGRHVGMQPAEQLRSEIEAHA
ncbi:thioredoxin family protein [Natrialbaceae archaeon A-gly3]